MMYQMTDTERCERCDRQAVVWFGRPLCAEHAVQAWREQQKQRAKAFG